MQCCDQGRLEKRAELCVETESKEDEKEVQTVIFPFPLVVEERVEDGVEVGWFFRDSNEAMEKG